MKQCLSEHCLKKIDQSEDGEKLKLRELATKMIQPGAAGLRNVNITLIFHFFRINVLTYPRFSELII